MMPYVADILVNLSSGNGLAPVENSQKKPGPRFNIR